MWAATRAHRGTGYFGTALLSGYPAGSCYTPSHNILKYNTTPEQICDKFSSSYTSAFSLPWSKVQLCRVPANRARTQPHRHNVSSSRGWHFRSWEGERNKKNLSSYLSIFHMGVLFSHEEFPVPFMKLHQAPAKEGGYSAAGRRKERSSSSYLTLHSYFYIKSFNKSALRHLKCNKAKWCKR